MSRRRVLMRVTLLLAVAVVFVPVAAAGQVAVGGREASGATGAPPALSESKLWIMVTVSGADDTSSAAGDSGTEAFDSYVWTDEGLCRLTAAAFAPATAPWSGWRIGGRVMHRIDDESYMAEIQWQRVWQNGARLADGPTGSMQVVMSIGASVLLDELDASSGPCGERRARLEATFGSWTALRANRLRSGLSDGPSIAGGVISFRNVGGASGGGGRAGASSVSGGARVGGGAGATGVSTGPLRPEGLPLPEDVELWLVHTLADGTERAQKQTVRLGGAGRRYAFPPLRVVAGGRELWFAVAGLVHLLEATDPRGPRLVVLIERAVTDASGERLSRGGASRTFDLLAPGAVTSLELPGPSSVDLAGQVIQVRIVHK